MSILVRKSIILKGDGVYAYHGGVPHLLTAPPPEAFHPDKDVPDVPPFAHYGNAKPHPDGHQGMGELIPGKFAKAKHGGMAYVDNDGQSHYHGIDGVMNRIGEKLEAKGILGQNHPQLGALTPENLVQLAIDETNQGHSDKSGFHNIPDVNSMEHRKNRVAPFAGRDPSVASNRSQSGDYVSQNTNRVNRKDKVGLHVESIRVPYNLALQNILVKELGLTEFAESDWLQNPYIDIEDLHPAGKRLKGRGGDSISVGAQGYSLPDTHIKYAPGGVQHAAAHTGIQSWEIMNHTPDLMHMMLGRQQTGPAATIRSANAHIDEALKVIDPDKIPDVEVPINSTPDSTGNPQYSMMNLRTVLRSPTMRKNMIGELSKTPAFNALFGRLITGSEAKPGVGKRVFDHLLQAFGPTDGGADYESMKSHAIPGQHLELSDGSTPTKGQSTHTAAAALYAKAMLSGAHEEHDSALRAYMPEDAEGNIDAATLKEMGLNIQSHGTVEQRRQGTQALADLCSEAFSHQTRRQLPEKIPTSGLASRYVQGYPEELITDLPSHIPFYNDISMSPVNQPASHTPQPVPPPTPPPQRREVAVAPPATEAALSPQPPRGAPSFREQSPELVAARQHVGRADPSSLRQIMESAGARVPQGQGQELSPQEQQYQQTMGDPRQQLLTQYMKGEDAHLSPMDRVMKAMEQMQIDDAMRDSEIMKHALPRQINVADEFGVRHLAKSVHLTPVDVRSIAHSAGDWERIAKRLNVPTNVVKVVKVSIGGI